MKRLLQLLLLLLLLPVCATAAAEKTMVIAPRVEDVYLAEQYIDGETTVMVITELTSAQRKELNAWLAERGAAEVVEGTYTRVSNTKAATLKKKWGISSGSKGYRYLVTQVRLAQPEVLVWSVDPAEEDLTSYVSGMMDQLVRDAYDPDFRGTDSVEQYGWTVTTLVNAADGTSSAVDVSDILAELTEKWGEAVTPEIPDAPELNAEGFLDSGSFSWKDTKAGTYYYVDEDIRVTITKHSVSRRIWYEADVVRRADSAEHLHVAQANEKGTKVKASTAAAGWVLAINSDYHQYRSGTSVGIILRNGEVISDKTTKTQYSNKLTTLDSLLLTKDGGFAVYPNTTLTA